MKRKWANLAWGAGLVWSLSAVLTVGLGQTVPARLAFLIATGSVAGSYFPIGESIAGVVSHPPGLARCDTAWVCGPPGLIVSARTSEGAVANVLAVNSGSVDSGLAQSFVVADAVKGVGVFRKQGPQTHIRAIASLAPESVQIVVAKSARIENVRDLRGKRVSLGAEGSGANVIAGEILRAYWMTERSVKARHDSYDASANLLQQGKIDAFFFQGTAPSDIVGDLLARGQAKLIAIDGAARRRLLKRVPALSADTISAGIYQNSPAVETVSARTLWVVKDSAPNDVIYGILRSLYNPANRSVLGAGSARRIRLDDATMGLTAPLHPGAVIFYRQMGKLPPQRS